MINSSNGHLIINPVTIKASTSESEIIFLSFARSYQYRIICLIQNQVIRKL